MAKIKNQGEIFLEVTIKGYSEAEAKIEKLIQKIAEANSLADELATELKNLEVEVKV